MGLFQRSLQNFNQSFLKEIEVQDSELYPLWRLQLTLDFLDCLGSEGLKSERQATTLLREVNGVL
jgi:hypothetical protein